VRRSTKERNSNFDKQNSGVAHFFNNDVAFEAAKMDLKGIAVMTHSGYMEPPL
jgi:hypothetical protein